MCLGYVLYIVLYVVLCIDSDVFMLCPLYESTSKGEHMKAQNLTPHCLLTLRRNYKSLTTLPAPLWGVYAMSYIQVAMCLCYVLYIVFYIGRDVFMLYPIYCVIYR
jgi:hypothetical protein